MGSVRSITGLAWRNVRHRPWQALLLLLALSLSTTTMTLALALNETGDRAWDRASRATNGFHVSADVAAPQDMSPERLDQVRADLARLGSAPGVVAAGGPWQIAQVDGEIDGAPIRLSVQVRDADPAAVDQPLVTAGQWMDDRQGVVLEDGLANAAGVQPGDTITIAGQPVPVRGAALTVAANPYPMSQPATLWISPATAARLGSAMDGGGYLIELRLADPDQAETFAATLPNALSVPPLWVEADTWQDTKGESVTDTQDVAASLAAMAAFVVGLTIATAGILVAGRMASQIRQVGTLKAVGVTPGQVTCVLLVEYLAVALLATSVGLAAGTLLTPPLAGLTRAMSVYGAQIPPITWPRIAIVVAVSSAVVLLATARPTLRGVRHSTVRSLGGNIRPPHRAGRMIRLVARLPLPLPVGLGLRTATRRPGRFIATTFGLTIGIALVIAGLALRTGVQDFRQRGLSLNDPDPISLAATTANLERLSTLGFTIAAFLIGLAVINAIIAAMFSANDSARNHAILRTLGTTPNQTVAAVLVAHLAACLLACTIGIPLGIALYSAIRGPTLDPIDLTPLTYIATVVTTLLLYAAIALTPARLLARRPITPQLTYE